MDIGQGTARDISSNAHGIELLLHGASATKRIPQDVPIGRLQAAGASWPLITAQAVSPVFGNNPAFKVLSLSPRNQELLDYRSVSYDLELSEPSSFGTLYEFSEAYGTAPPLGPAMNTLFPALAADPARRGMRTRTSTSPATTGQARSPRSPGLRTGVRHRLHGAGGVRGVHQRRPLTSPGENRKTQPHPLGGDALIVAGSYPG